MTADADSLLIGDWMTSPVQDGDISVCGLIVRSSGPNNNNNTVTNGELNPPSSASVVKLLSSLLMRTDKRCQTEKQPPPNIHCNSQTTSPACSSENTFAFCYKILGSVMCLYLSVDRSQRGLIISPSDSFSCVSMCLFRLFL